MSLECKTQGFRFKCSGLQNFDSLAFRRQLFPETLKPNPSDSGPLPEPGGRYPLSGLLKFLRSGDL